MKPQSEILTPLGSDSGTKLATYQSEAKVSNLQAPTPLIKLSKLKNMSPNFESDGPITGLMSITMEVLGRLLNYDHCLSLCQIMLKSLLSF